MEQSNKNIRKIQKREILDGSKYWIHPTEKLNQSNIRHAKYWMYPICDTVTPLENRELKETMKQRNLEEKKFRAVQLQKYNSYFSDLNFLITSIYDLNKRNNKRIIIGTFTDDSQN